VSVIYPLKPLTNHLLSKTASKNHRLQSLGEVTAFFLESQILESALNSGHKPLKNSFLTFL
jgi:hypothetical protein